MIRRHFYPLSGTVAPCGAVVDRVIDPREAPKSSTVSEQSTSNVEHISCEECKSAMAKNGFFSDVKLTIRNCSACGGNHLDLGFKRLEVLRKIDGKRYAMISVCQNTNVFIYSRSNDD